MQEYHGIPLPQIIEQDQLEFYVEQAQKGDLEAKQTVLKHTMRFVIWLVSSTFSCTLKKNPVFTIEDAISVGFIGLSKAVDNYKKERKVSFLSFSYRCVLNEVLMEMRKYRGRDTIYFTDLFLKQDHSSYQHNLFVENIEDTYFHCLLYETLNESKQILDETEKYIIEKRYNNDNKVSQETLSKTLGISQSYLSRLERKALSKMKNFYQKEGYQEKGISHLYK